MAYRHLDRLHREWGQRRGEIGSRLGDFRRLVRGDTPKLFEELVFCLLATQTSARRCDAAVREMAANGLLWRGTPTDLATFLRRRVRFHNHKAEYIAAARKRFLAAGEPMGAFLDSLGTPAEAREWLVREVNGLGYKEASHFLRNVGRGEQLAIIDRHVLANLRFHGAIRTIPTSLSRKRYLAVERKVRVLSEAAGIPMAALDLLLWSRETGEVFK